VLKSSQPFRHGDEERPKTMTEQKNQIASLFDTCWKDEALKARFMADPKAVLAERDRPVPDGMDIKIQLWENGEETNRSLHSSLVLRLSHDRTPCLDFY
jgi:hypothetical protein